MEEKWKIIDNYSDYQVSNLGRIKSLKKWNDGLKERILKFRIGKHGYSYVVLCKNDIRKTLKVHRLVLMTFKPIVNPEYFQCNHIDGNKLNNNIDNLEWCSPKENTNHAIKTGLMNQNRENNSFYGKKHTQETKEKISKFNKINSLGKHPTKETKEKISKSKIGERNPNNKLSKKKLMKLNFY